ncbi:DUF664 domain-containing protein [Streptomyces cinerochromogenes]|uniref:DUF664 domain-containing protein n=1 Tax=Streptomyces cinerochromogenes TaxID=66422 RepID=A0ABW7B1F2_9ACTN
MGAALPTLPPRPVRPGQHSTHRCRKPDPRPARGRQAPGTLPAGRLPSLDDTVNFRGETVSLRYVLTHMIDEYARHNGHADLLREAIDGAVGE